MQTRLGLRTVRKSGSDVSHDAPQSVSPFHPPVKFDEKQLKQVVSEERPAKRRSTRLDNDNKDNNNKDSQRTLFNTITPSAGPIEKSRSSTRNLTTINKKRTTSKTTKESVIEHQPKKQRIYNDRKQQQHHEEGTGQEIMLNVQQQMEQEQQAAVLETVVQRVTVEQSRAKLVESPQEVPALFNVTENTTTSTEQASSLTSSPSSSALLPTASPLSSPKSATHEELTNPDDRSSVVDKEQQRQQPSNHTELFELKSTLNETARVEESIERPANVEKTEEHEASPKVNIASRDNNASSSAVPVLSQPIAETQEVPAWKQSFYIQSDKARVQDEKGTLHKLRNALDVSLMFHAANQRIAMFHKIQPMLRNTTKKNITIGHLAKILYLAPMLYRVEPKILGHQGRQVESYAVELGADWKAPLSGKQLEERENILEDKMEGFFIANKGKLVIPEKELPKIDKVVDRKKWIETANLPSGVRDLLQLEERRKEEAEKAKATQPPLTGTGTVKDRRQALLERIRSKSKK
ncbi:hypothetical protein BDB00DRAFT_976901 [Zychaea mexicana]|uniref:uncharacterized protein n=1 Tax=Zychaea mexicana TaxID=64656 RepID=UPI0022FE120B|nr:uncharacterized protein BDB00DRAFT_976901 [Zychaea mexicana]KAI9492451.1 hypothetical protein BDB00DRAFT_976901 [Zychaea mexicana]